MQTDSTIHPLYKAIGEYEATEIHNYLPGLIRLLVERRDIARNIRAGNMQLDGLEFLKAYNVRIVELLQIPIEA